MQIRVLTEEKGGPTAGSVGVQGDRSQGGGGEPSSAEKKKGWRRGDGTSDAEKGKATVVAVETRKADAAQSGMAAAATPEGFVVVGHCDAAAGASIKEEEEEEEKQGNVLVLAEAAYDSGCVLVALDPIRPTALKLTIGGGGGGGKGGASGGGVKTVLLLGATDT